MDGMGESAYMRDEGCESNIDVLANQRVSHGEIVGKGLADTEKTPQVSRNLSSGIDSPIYWGSLTAEDFNRIESLVIKMAVALPCTIQVHTGFTSRGNEALEHMIRGDEVFLLSNWASTKHGPRVTLKIKAPKNKVLGCLGGQEPSIFEGHDDRESLMVLACMLPHLKATVHSVTPLSMRSKGVDNPLLSIRVDLKPVDMGELLSGVRTLFDKDLKERKLSTEDGD